eukprot:CAMPEP_0197645002 /NCGR_PEP_ID=MMETSP1338-20131121/17798_1 /TAXON_ID=43686 ORGANISM="Pelagodinium beii, Strain RCC1491" /NCGR_SAMPLE_ID=MMETSP1338 /ASSEMBLY_ACC=CAM_ASM_000754 /LENGTH=41 /DNA_ID= /DNA_START= /DNA_END= /DNA_ORIENTATION=
MEWGDEHLLSKEHLDEIWKHFDVKDLAWQPKQGGLHGLHAP